MDWDMEPLVASWQLQPSPPPSPLQFLTMECKQFLCEHGYVVIPGVVEKEECDRSFAELLASFAVYDPELRPDNDEAWRSHTLPVGTVHGINRLCGHLPFQWRLRQHPNVVRVFAEYWNVRENELVVSFDAFNYYRAGQPRLDPSRTYWAHTDQGPAAADGREPLDGMCLQGYVNLVDSTGPYDGTLVVYDKGHRAHAGFFTHRCNAQERELARKGNWHKFSVEWMSEIGKDARRYLQHGDADKQSPSPVAMLRTRVHAPAGAMVLWFSKTPHENQAPGKTHRKDVVVHDRAVQYISMAPKRYLTERDIARRAKAWSELRQCSHWASGGQFSLFPKYPRMYSKHTEELKARIDALYELQEKNRPELTELGKSLLDYHRPPEVGSKRKQKIRDDDDDEHKKPHYLMVEQEGKMYSI